jgi:DNA-binding NarL/FixJ family response regulator
MSGIRVLVADDQPLVRALRPEIVLMDVRMPIFDGIEATRRLVEAGSEARVVVLTTFGHDEYVLGTLRAGASGFVFKEALPEEIVAAIHVVATGDALISPAVTRSVIEELPLLAALEH